MCGYRLTGLDINNRCPECGRLNSGNILDAPTVGRIAKFKFAWRHCESLSSKCGAGLSVFSFILGVANSCLAMYFMYTLIYAPGFGGFAGIPIIFTPLIWICIQIPIDLLNGILLGISRTTAWLTTLRFYSGVCISFGTGGSLVIIIMATVITILKAWSL